MDGGSGFWRSSTTAVSNKYVHKTTNARSGLPEDCRVMLSNGHSEGFSERLTGSFYKYKNPQSKTYAVRLFFVKIVFDICHVFFGLSSKPINFVRIVNQTVKAKHAKMAYGTKIPKASIT